MAEQTTAPDRHRTELARLATRLATRGITLTPTVVDAALAAIDAGRQRNTELTRQLTEARNDRDRWQVRARTAEQLATTRLTAALRTLADLRGLDEHGDRVRAGHDTTNPATTTTES